MDTATLQTFIPDVKLKAVEKALQTAFNTTTVDSISLLTGGLSSALVYKIVVQGKAYVMRVIMRVDPLNDPARQYLCNRMASEAGIAPQLFYADAESAISISAFIETVPVMEHGTLITAMAERVRQIHTLPLFPPLVNFMDGVEIFIQNFNATGLLPESATAEHFRYYAEIQTVYPRHDPDLVSSHNDLNAMNVLFDGQQLWVIDWETAFQNDRYVDLAITATNFVKTVEDETLYLTTYLGEMPDDYQRARLFLMQQVCQMYYGMILLNFAAALRTPQVQHDDSMTVPRRSEFYQMVVSGKVNLSTYEGQLMMGKVMLSEMLHAMKTPRFAESIELVRLAETKTAAQGQQM